MIKEILFYFFAIITVLASIYMIFSKNPIKSAFSMFLVFLFTGMIYLLMGLYFIGAIQIIIYAGAIMSLFVIAIPTMVNASKVEKEGVLKDLFAYIVIFILLLSIFPFILNTNKAVEFQKFDINVFSLRFFSQYWLEIELISILLLVAITGAYMFLSKDKRAK